MGRKARHGKAPYLAFLRRSSEATTKPEANEAQKLAVER